MLYKLCFPKTKYGMLKFGTFLKKKLYKFCTKILQTQFIATFFGGLVNIYLISEFLQLSIALVKFVIHLLVIVNYIYFSDCLYTVQDLL